MGPGQSHVPVFVAPGCYLHSWWSSSGNSLGLAFTPGCSVLYVLRLNNSRQFYRSCLNWSNCDAPPSLEHMQLPSGWQSGLIIPPLWSEFHRPMHSTSQFDKTSLSKCVCLCLCTSTNVWPPSLQISQMQDYLASLVRRDSSIDHRNQSTDYQIGPVTAPADWSFNDLSILSWRNLEKCGKVHFVTLLSFYCPWFEGSCVCETC